MPEVDACMLSAAQEPLSQQCGLDLVWTGDVVYVISLFPPFSSLLFPAFSQASAQSRACSLPPCLPKPLTFMARSLHTCLKPPAPIWFGYVQMEERDEAAMLRTRTMS
eukprot:564662-Rhodomonas_salina.2